jgi:L-threonylcarbamoyladenylate synthase
MLGDAVAYILDGGSCDSGIESTIVGFEQGVPVIYRKGVITEQEIRAVAGATHRHSGNAIHAPGMSASHYSPDTMLVLTENLEAALAQYSHMYTGVLTYNQYTGTIPENRQIKLCDNDDWKTAARNLYAAMHRMDRDGYDIIIARRFPEYGIAAAINDRLQRASAKK